MNNTTARPLLFGGIGVAGFTAGLLIAWAALPLAALAAEPADPVPAATTVPITVYGDDPCPKGVGGTIVVCARRPENERYRLPKRFRGSKAEASPANNSWANKVQTVEQAGRVGAGLPDTCSAVGSGGQTGCYMQMLQQSRAQRVHDKSEADAAP